MLLPGYAPSTAPYHVSALSARPTPYRVGTSPGPKGSPVEAGCWHRGVTETQPTNRPTNRPPSLSHLCSLIDITPHRPSQTHCSTVRSIQRLSHLAALAIIGLWMTSTDPSWHRRSLWLAFFSPSPTLWCVVPPLQPAPLCLLCSGSPPPYPPFANTYASVISRDLQARVSPSFGCSRPLVAVLPISTSGASPNNTVSFRLVLTFM